MGSNLKGQVTIWIIMAILVVAVVVLFMMFQKEVGEPPGAYQDIGEVVDVNPYLRSCVGEEVRRVTGKMMPRGGFVSPSNFKIYNKTEVALICETKSYFEPCINQHPMLISEMEREIEREIFSGVESCIRDLKDFVEDKGGIVEMSSELDLDVELDFDRILVKIEKDISIDYKEQKEEFEELELGVQSAAYNLAIVAQEIAMQEATFCYFETAGYSLANPRYLVVRKMMSDQTKIYLIRDKDMNEVMQVAVRSCYFPEGMPG